MTISTNRKIGSIKDDQITIDEKINTDLVNNLIFNNKKYLQELIKKEIDNKFLLSLNSYIKKNQLPFSLTKQMEIYLNNNRDNLSLIFKYLAFRLKFHLCANKLIEIDCPPYILVELVSSCNLRCPFCYQTDKSFTKKPFMGVMNEKLFKKIIDDADESGVGAITLGSRGEPSLHKDVSEFVDYIGTKKNFFEKKFITNGSKLDLNLANSLLRNNFNIIQISADHYIKKDYERLRLGSNFEKTVNNVDNLYKLRNTKYKNSPIEIRISGVDFEKKLDKKKFKDFWIKRSDHVTAGLPIERWNTYENSTHPELNTPCKDLWFQMYIWFDGKTNPCDADYKSVLNFGDMNNNTIKEIWNSKKIIELRNKHMKGKRNEIFPCDRCGVDFQD